MDADAPRSRSARAAAETALVRVVHHYGARPEFVVLGGLVPELLCAANRFHHAGTTDVDVQVDLEIAYGAVNTTRLERALRNAEFEPDHARVWRWVAANNDTPRTVVRFELLADLDTAPAGATVAFDACEDLGAVNLRGTGFAARDTVVQELRARTGGVLHIVAVHASRLPAGGVPFAGVMAVSSGRRWPSMHFTRSIAWLTCGKTENSPGPSWSPRGLPASPGGPRSPEPRRLTERTQGDSATRRSSWVRIWRGGRRLTTRFASTCTSTATAVRSSLDMWGVIYAIHPTRTFDQGDGRPRSGEDGQHGRAAVARRHRSGVVQELQRRRARAEGDVGERLELDGPPPSGEARQRSADCRFGALRLDCRGT